MTDLKHLSHHRFQQVLKRYGCSCDFYLAAGADADKPWQSDQENNAASDVANPPDFTGLVLIQDWRLDANDHATSAPHYRTDALCEVTMKQGQDLSNAVIIKDEQSWRILSAVIVSEDAQSAIFQLVVVTKSASVPALLQQPLS